MEMTGRRQAVVDADARGVMSKVAEAARDPGPNPMNYAKAGLAAGALAGGAGMGLLAHHLNKSTLEGAVKASKGLTHPTAGHEISDAGHSVLSATLGGAAVGGAGGVTAGTYHGLKKAIRHSQERAPQDSAREPEQEYRTQDSAKSASAFKSLVQKHPAVTGAAALGLPTAAVAGARAYHKHHTQAGGDSRAHVDASAALHHHDLHVAAKGREGAHDRLKRRYLAIHEELLADAARHPRASALASALVFGLPMARVGAKYGPKLLGP